jgi:hypothetical protein
MDTPRLDNTRPACSNLPAGGTHHGRHRHPRLQSRWKIDPIVRSLIDTDFYKLLMCQSVFRNRPDTQVTFSLINRTTRIPLANLIDEGELARAAGPYPLAVA